MFYLGEDENWYLDRFGILFTNNSRYNNTAVLFDSPRALLRVTAYVTYLSSHGGATTVYNTGVLLHTPCACLQVTSYVTLWVILHNF
uniref:Uncharacterized protein n=1 Tax=Ciona intestinalis TaxID=7719 RepID=H2XKF7_CIOIN